MLEAAEDELGTAEEPDLKFEYLQGLSLRCEPEAAMAAAELGFVWERGATLDRVVGLDFAPELDAEPGPGLGTDPRAAAASGLALERAPEPALETEPEIWRAELRGWLQSPREPRAGSGPRAERPGAEPPWAEPGPSRAGPGADPAPWARPVLEVPAEPASLPPQL